VDEGVVTRGLDASRLPEERENVPHGFSKIPEDEADVLVDSEESVFHGFGLAGTNPEPASEDVCAGSSPQARSVSRLLSSAVFACESDSCPVLRRSLATPTYASCTTDSAAEAFEDSLPQTDFTLVFAKKSGCRIPELLGVAGELDGATGDGLEEGNPRKENAEAEDIGLKLSGLEGVGRGVPLDVAGEAVGERDRGVALAGVSWEDPGSAIGD
jgi:hypothetical protein